MLTKFISIKNVGRFRNSAATPNPQLSKHTFIAGANGSGKTTICAVLRSLDTGEGDHIIGRKTLGVSSLSTVDLLFDTGPIRFDGSAWSVAKPSFGIFDGVFVGENVHAGEIVDVAQKRNLYRVIVGEAGVRLATEDADLAAESRAKTSEITASARGLQPHFAAGMMSDEFLALAKVDDIDDQIAAQQTNVNAIRQAETLSKKAALSALPIPTLPTGFPAILDRTIDDIAEDAETRLETHLAAHGMTDGGGNWISSGIEYAGDDCPFCGQDIRGLPLVSAFRVVFSQTYKDLRAEISMLQDALSQQFGEATLATQTATAEKTKAAIEFWQEYVTFDWQTTQLPDSFADTARQLRTQALALLEAKARAPLERVEFTPGYNAALQAYTIASASLEQVNANILQANTLIAAKKAQSGAANLADAEKKLAVLKATATRYGPAVSALCDEHVLLTRLKETVDAQRGTVRAQLDAHTSAVVRPYQNRINALLDAFNAGFTIAETSHSYPGGIASSSYQLVINDMPVDIGNSKTPNSEPSFKNTLSAGDRTTLALAFFFAHLEADPSLSEKIVVFDDPFTSQDSFRRGQTVHEIMKLARSCKQMIVLSHDATFLKQLWLKAPPSQRVSFTIADHRDLGSKLLEVDLERACQGRTATDVDDLRTFLSSGAGGLIDIVRKMRVVLEAYCRTTFSGSFQDNDWLGDMVRKIREGGATHPAAALYDELDQINDYSAQYHHGENTQDLTPDQIDSTALTGYARRTLKIVNALQA
jgi:wobble nucleotide-excising tRNase